MGKEKPPLIPKREKIIQILEKDLERLLKMKALLPDESTIIDDEKERAEIEAIKVKIQTLEKNIDLVKERINYVEKVGVHLDPVPDLISTIGKGETEEEEKMLAFQKEVSGILIQVNPGETPERMVAVTPPYINNGSKKMPGMEDNRALKEFMDKDGKPIQLDETVNDLLANDLTYGKKDKKIKEYVKIGKATPGKIKEFLEASIKKKMLNLDLSKSDQEISQKMRDFLFQYGIGTDCTGLAAQAMNYQKDGNLTFEEGKEILIGGTIGVSGVERLDWSGYEKDMYQKVASPKKLQAGDMMFIHAASAKDFLKAHRPINEDDDGQRGKHVRIVTDVDQKDNIIIFMTVEAALSYDAVSGAFREDSRGGVGVVLWRYEEDSFGSPIYRSVDNGDTWHLWTKDLRTPVFLRRKKKAIKKKLYYDE